MSSGTSLMMTLAPVQAGLALVVMDTLTCM